MNSKEAFLQETLAFWQPRTTRKLTEDDARDIQQTLYDFYCILHDWYLQDHPELRNPVPEREAS